MSIMTMLFVVWGVFTAVLVLLLIYRSTLTMHEDDQLFLDTAEDHMQKEQQDLLKRMNRVTPWVRVFGAASVLLIATIGGLALYANMTR
jgi:hypothetical protein